ncbi:aspartate aminotransferase family protein [Simiduia agarivorans]|uniref:Aminotransferase n=1 Tax=Simiduia agarivorans (strain DSM 21679 / JCM 13881 / BCRC 17597 / SA1) TaxID=1117647 RepID=K4KHI3_SIMAS|nr:aspartate aminotransferase family protein [Simiduia agarivorans]AFU98574.1 aminotransferase [Simiduia agarivorans SA1 = DSM 21679]
MSQVYKQRSTAEWQSMDAGHYLHPFTDFADQMERGSRIITKAEGPYIYTSEGQKILDGMSGLWCCNLGYGQEEIVSAVTEQLRELPFYNSFFQCAHPPSIELSTKLAELAAPHMNNVFFTGSGSEANDTVIRMVHRYWDLKGEPDRKIFISRHNAYHGSTIGGASLGGMGGMHSQFTRLPYVHHVDQPYWFGEGGDMDKDAFGLKAAQSLETKILELGADKVAAFIGEPIQGAGGVIVPPATYWPEIQRICDKYGILLVTDEVICGFGRTGHWFGADYFGVKPDLMPFAKGVTNGYQPLGGVMVGDRVAGVLKSQGGEFAHGYTYSGHPAACAAALATIKILERDKVLESVREGKGKLLQDKLATLADHPIVGEVRGVGFVAAIELTNDKQARTRFDDNCTAGALCRAACIESGLVMRAVGDTMIIAPPLTMTEAQIDELVTKARKALDLTQQRLGK